MLFPKQKPLRNKDYLKFVSNLPCCVCKTPPPSDAHHIEKNGISSKGSDYSAIPCCHKHHMEYHKIGRTSFANKYLLDYYCVMAKVLGEYIEELRRKSGDNNTNG